MSFLTDTTITHTYPYDEHRGIVYTDLSLVRVPIERQEEYYGQVSIVFDYDKTLESSGLI